MKSGTERTANFSTRARGRAAATARRPFGQIILAAPDVDRDVFAQLAAAHARLADRATPYTSRCDLAVAASEFVHDYHRASYGPPVTVVDGLDTVDVADYFDRTITLRRGRFKKIRFGATPIPADHAPVVSRRGPRSGPLGVRRSPRLS